MPTLTIRLEVADELAAQLADDDMVVTPVPPGRLDTWKATVDGLADLIRVTLADVAAVRAILADPSGDPAAMGAALARLARLGAEHEAAVEHLAAMRSVLDASLVAKRIGPEDGATDRVLQ